MNTIDPNQEDNRIHPRAPRIIQVKFSEEDIDKLTDTLLNKFMSQFQLNVGKGILEYAWKAFIAGCIVIAFYQLKR